MPANLLLSLLLATLHLNVQGTGRPTVILESGFNGTSAAWVKVQPEVAKFATVVAYDRAGLGRSVAGKTPRTAKRIAQELHKALKAKGLAPPYVLVGHSAGAAYTRVFAKMYPKEVAGIVLVDPPHEELLDWLRVHAPDADRIPSERLAEMPEGVRAEWDARTAVIEEMRKAWPLPRVPILLITSAKNDAMLSRMVSGEAVDVLLDARKKFLARAKGAKHIVTEKSGHNVPREEPELIVEAVREVWSAAR